MMPCLPAIYTVDGDISWRALNSFLVVAVSDDFMVFSDVAFGGMFSALSG